MEAFRISLDEAGLADRHVLIREQIAGRLSVHGDERLMTKDK